MMHFAEGGSDGQVTEARAGELLGELVRSWGSVGRVLLVPPDHTRLHSWAGFLTVWLYECLRDSAVVRVLPALGTHVPMAAAQRAAMFPGIPDETFLVHDWRAGVREVGQVPAEFLREVSGGRVAYPIACALNTDLLEGGWDRIVSIGQLMPHEVVGIANHNKNILVGTGGKDIIDKTHFLGAACGMESIMGRARTPVRAVLDRMAAEFLAEFPITWLLTVRSRDATGRLVTRGLYAGDDTECFHRGAALCQQVNLDLLDDPIRRAVVWLDPAEFHSTWLGNKAIYRLRMAMADGGELIVLGPGVDRFGEDAGIDALIRRHGYHGTEAVLAAVERDAELAAILSAAAHLIHGSTEGRFRVVWCAGGLSRAEIEGVGYAWADPAEAMRRWDPARLQLGINRREDGESVFFVPNPALGLWALRERFANEP